MLIRPQPCASGFVLGGSLKVISQQCADSMSLLCVSSPQYMNKLLFFPPCKEPAGPGEGLLMCGRLTECGRLSEIVISAA